MIQVRDDEVKDAWLACGYGGCTPAPEPAAMSGNRRRCLLRRREPRARAELRPMSTEGPSGPREAPLPSVMAAASALRTGDAARCSRACATASPYVSHAR